MADVVPDELERELGVDEPLHTGVAQRVGSGAGHSDPRAMQIVRRALGHRRGGQRHLGRQHPEEDPPVGRLRSSVLKVLHQRCAHGRRQGVGGRVASLALGDPQPIVLPIEIVHGQGRDLARAQPIGHQQEEDGVIPLAADRAPVHHLQHPSHLVPGDGARDRRQAVGSRGLDGGAEISGDQPLPVQIPKNHPQDAAQTAQARPTEPPAALGHERVEDRRGQDLEIHDPDRAEVGLELGQMVAVEPDARGAQSALDQQVFEELPRVPRKRLLRPAGSAAPHEAGHHQAEHLLDRLAGHVGDFPAGAFGATALPTLADPGLDKRIDMRGQLLPCRHSARAGKVPEALQERDAATHIPRGVPVLCEPRDIPLDGSGDP